MSRCACCDGECQLSAADRAEVERFRSWLGIEASRKAGGDPAMLNVLEAALYPEGIGRPPVDPVDA